MIQHKPILLFLLGAAVLFSACNGLKRELGMAADYLPSPTYLKDGIVNKYYAHSLDDNGYDRITSIHYRHYQLTSPNELIIKFYNPAMELSGIMSYRFEDNVMKVNRQENYFRGDTILTAFINPDYLDWAENGANFHFQRKYPSGAIEEVQQQQTHSADTLIEHRKAKIVQKSAERHIIYNQDTTTTHRHYTTSYLKGIGLFGYEMIDGEKKVTVELVEQMPYSEFRKRASHGVKRIGYIDPRSVLDQGSDFSLCDKHEKVVDYYNGSDKRAQYKGGKRALWQLVNQHLEPEKLLDESGYLTLRFIVNCEGEAGWFTMEEADLDFQPKKFPSETIQHFFDILSQHPDWKPCIINDEARDAYTYITFKLSHGKIIEILP